MSRELKYPQWQEPFRNAIAEFGTQQLGEKLQKVEAMILDRLHVLSSDIKSLAERQAGTFRRNFDHTYLEERQNLFLSPSTAAPASGVSIPDALRPVDRPDILMSGNPF